MRAAGEGSPGARRARARRHPASGADPAGWRQERAGAACAVGPWGPAGSRPGAAARPWEPSVPAAAAAVRRGAQAGPRAALPRAQPDERSERVPALRARAPAEERRGARTARARVAVRSGAQPDAALPRREAAGRPEVEQRGALRRPADGALPGKEPRAAETAGAPKDARAPPRNGRAAFRVGACAGPASPARLGLRPSAALFERGRGQAGRREGRAP